MSFRLFIYYSALCGGAGALLGWGLGRLLAPGESLLDQGLKGLWLGVILAFALSLIDALWNFRLTQVFSILPRVIIATLVGSMAGLLGGLIAEALYRWQPWGAFRVFGYTIAGMLIGMSMGVFDLLSSLATNRQARGAVRKVKNGLLGGTLGGILGGSLSLFLHGYWEQLFHDKETDLLWSPSAAAFVALGICIGLMVGLAQVLLKEAWIKVEEGFRAGRALILSRPEMTIGRAENCDIALFGDPGVDRLHATIRREGNVFILQDAGSATGTFINDEPLYQPRILCSGDIIRVGRCVLRFGERSSHQ